MLFPRRRRVVTDIKSVSLEAGAKQLARKLTEMTWCGCNGFRLGDYLFLNDSTSPDGAQEYAVVHEPSMLQCESITFSWCSRAKALEYILKTIRGEFKPWREPTLPKPGQLIIQTQDEHGTCVHCA